MRVKAKKLAQRAVVISFSVCYVTLLFIWVTTQYPISISSTSGSNSGSNGFSGGHSSDHLSSGDSAFISFQERAPRSVADTDKTSIDLLNHNYRKDLRQFSNNFVNYSDFNNQYKNELKLKQIKIYKPFTSLNDIFISVKTTKKFHSTRLDIILKTWFELAKNQTFFFTDANDRYYNQKSGGHLINTNCSSSHNRKALCCKMSVEFDTFIESTKRWFCHFDDDNYVNVPQLVQLLRKYNPLEDWYLGKPSIRQPLEIVSRDNKQKKISFWFATGGAGFCLSRALALKMVPIASGGKFISISEKIRLPDDVTLGYIVEHLLSKRLTVIESLHSHLEPMKFLKPNSLSQQISFSYSRFGNQINTLSIDGGLDSRRDETRFLSLHCHLFPNLKSCHI